MSALSRYPVVWFGSIVALGYVTLPWVVPARVEVEKDWDSGLN